ncbi:MAG: hypothetical protein AAFR84_11120 [Pseudomonadota bacterium]
MYTLTMVLSFIYWGLLAAVLGGQVVEGAMVSAVLIDVPGVGSARLEDGMISTLALSLPAALFLVAGGIALMLRIRQQRLATERVLVGAEG